MPADRPRVADVIPRMQMRGAETFAQHLEVALRDRYEMTLFTLRDGDGGSKAETAVSVNPPLKVSPGISSHREASRLKAARNLRKRVEPFGPALVAAHGGEPLVAAVLGRLHQVAPIVYIRVATPPPRARTGPRSAALRRAYSRVSAFVAIDESLRNDLSKEFAIPPERIRVIPNGRPRLDPLGPQARADIRRRAGVPEGSAMVAWVGAFVPEKDPLAAVRIASMLGPLHPGAHLVMVGDGPLMAECRRAAKGLDNIHFLGTKPDVGGFIASSDLLCSTSATEGTPGVVVEALLAGVPVVAPNLGGMSKAVPHDAGILVPPADKQAIARAIAKVLADERQRFALSAGAKRAGERFEIDSVAAEYDELYKEVMKQSATQS